MQVKLEIHNWVTIVCSAQVNGDIAEFWNKVLNECNLQEKKVR